MAESKEDKESHRIQITVAVIGAIAVILAAIIGILPSLLRDRNTAPALPTNPVPMTGAPPSAGITRTGVALPPEFASNIHSAEANYGCGILFGAPNDEPLSVCGLMPRLPAEWVSNIRRLDADCEKAASDRIILELWTGENYEGEYWAYTFGC
jgi:hypothetical protein